MATQLDVIKKVATKSGIRKDDCELVIACYYEELVRLLKGGNFINSQIGTFFVGKREARNGRNPRTGATIRIPAANTPKIKWNYKVKEAVN